jgi:phospholipid/cholesterol/gamma-HCH transport system permease protein
MVDGDNQTGRGTVSFGLANDATLVIRFAGRWHLDKNLPPPMELVAALDSIPAPKRISFEAGDLVDWDSGLLSFVTEADELCRSRGITADRSGLPDGLRRLLELAEAVPEKKGTQAASRKESFFARIGASTLVLEAAASEFLSFVGQLTVAFGSLLRGKARFRTVDLIEVIQQCGASAVGTVTLISFLVGGNPRVHGRGSALAVRGGDLCC